MALENLGATTSRNPWVGTRWRLQALVLTNGDSQKCSQQSRDPRDPNPREASLAERLRKGQKSGEYWWLDERFLEIRYIRQMARALWSVLTPFLMWFLGEKKSGTTSALFLDWIFGFGKHHGNLRRFPKGTCGCQCRNRVILRVCDPLWVPVTASLWPFKSKATSWSSTDNKLTFFSCGRWWNLDDYPFLL